MAEELYGPVGRGLGVVAGLISINGDVTPAQSLVNGTNITIVDNGGGSHTINSTAGLVSINTDVTPAQTLVNGTNVNIVDNGGGSHTINASGIQTINADATQDQTIGGLIYTSGQQSIAVTDLGAGEHRIDQIAVLQEARTIANPPGVSVPPGVETTIISVTIPCAGWWVWTANLESVGIPGSLLARLHILVGPSDIGVSTKFVSLGTLITTYADSVTSYVQPYVGGETVIVSMLQESVGTISVGCVLNGLRFGS